MMIKSLGRKGQSELIAGLIILSVIFAVVIPLMVRIQTATVQRQTEVEEKAKFLEYRSKESLIISGVPNTDENVRRGIFPGLWINNSGSIPVTLHTVLLIDKDTGRITYTIDMAYAERNPLVDWAVINPGPSAKHLTAGEYPTLSPGERLLIKLALTADEASQYYVKVITGRGSLLPTGGGTEYLVPPSGGAAGGTTWRGLFYPISGFKLMGGEKILENSEVIAERPEGRADDGKVTGVTYSYIYDDLKHPGYYIVGYVTGSKWIEYRGFMGTFSMGEDSATGGLYVYVDGYYMEKYRNGVRIDSRGVKVFSYPGLYGEIHDNDGNNLSELALNTIPYDADQDYNTNDDVLLMKVIVAKDITNADYVRISAKVTYDYYLEVINAGRPNYRMDLRIFFVAVYRYTDSGWRFVHYKDVPFSEHGPRSFVFDAIFPLNRTDIYRVALILIDPYRSTQRSYYEFYIGLEYFFAEWGINNPYFEDLPTVYLLALNDYTTGGIGGDDKLSNLTDLMIKELLSVGVTNYVVIDNNDLLNNILLDHPPKKAIVINLHGTQSPISSTTVINNIKYNGWIWVNIVGNPPIKPPGVLIDSGTLRNATVPSGSDGAYMIGNFSLYNLPLSIVSNYSATTDTAPPTYVFYDVLGEDRVVSAAWRIGEGYLVLNTLPELDWGGSDPLGTDPSFDASLAVFTALYIWLTPK